MPRQPNNVHVDFRDAVLRDSLACELALALEGIFEISSFRNLRKYDGKVGTLFCKPSVTVSRSLLLDRQVLALIMNYPDIHARTITIAEELITTHNPQLDPNFVIIVHADREGDAKLRGWGKERNLTVLPIYRPRAGALPSSLAMRQLLSRELFASDPFQVTGPVSFDIDFFGRREDTKELLRQLEHGRLRAIFGLRKVGKTSVINRLVRASQEAKSVSLAMVDCSIDEFNSLDSNGALQAIATTVRLASARGYAHVADALSVKGPKEDLMETFSSLWKSGGKRRLALVFDEVDYITPASPTASKWRLEFNKFWRKLRAVIQEAQRQGASVALLVSGVSSKYFRIEQIESAENSALNFVPEEYLAPFAPGAAEAMITDLGKRCGLQFSQGARSVIAAGCGGFPYWIRMMGSHMHKALDVDARPLEIDEKQAKALLEDFAESDGQEIVRVALDDLGRKDPEILAQLRECSTSPSGLTAQQGRILVKYGLASLSGGRVRISSALIAAAVGQTQARTESASILSVESSAKPTKYSVSEWAEELAVLNRRRNLLEKGLRDFVRFTLKAQQVKSAPWNEHVLGALSAERRVALSALSSDQLMQKLYWKELGAIVSSLWPTFERTIGDKARFATAMELLNDRFDAHAKDADAADIALHRRELTWLEERVLS